MGSLSRVPSQPVLSVHKWGAPFTITQSLLDVFGTVQFLLTDIAQSASYAALYQQYCLMGVEIFFRPMFRATSIVDDTTVVMPLLFVASDPNDISSWATLADARNAENVTVNDDSQGFCVKFSPQAAVAAYNGAFAGFASTSEKVWIDTTYNTVRHYGLKYCITGNGLASNYQAWSVETRYHFQFRFGR